jgi:hypothetical protein
MMLLLDSRRIINRIFEFYPLDPLIDSFSTVEFHFG